MGSSRTRLEGIDLLRGLVMVAMTFDHTRDYAFGAGVGDPMRIEEVGVAMYLTRLLSHFCAPTFILLAGVSARLLRHRGTPPSELARYLIVRGLVLVAFELTLVDWAWNFNPLYSMKYLQVIWAIGWSMVLLGLLVRLPPRVITAVGAVLVVGHGAVEGLASPEGGWLAPLWAVFFEKQVLDTPLWFSVRTTYPIAAPMGLVLLGYGLGGWFGPDLSAASRRRRLLQTGVACSVAFLVLRVTNLYGDPHPFELASSGARSLMAFFNPTKYPLSLQFVLLALGPGLLLLGWAEGRPSPGPAFARRLGKVPMFYYLAHLYVIHVGGLLWARAAGAPWSSFDFSARLGGFPEGFGMPLWGTHLLAVLSLLLLLPACTRYAEVRRRVGGLLRYI